MKTPLLTILTLLAAAPLLNAADEGPKPPELRDFVQPIYPRAALDAALYSGEVEVILDLDAEGRVRDHLVLRATHQSFRDSLSRVIGDWVFEPGYVDGKAVPTVKQVTVLFEYGDPVGLQVSPALVSAWVNSMRQPDQPESYLVTIRDLDAALKPMVQVRPGLPEDVPAAKRKGEVVFEYFIDQTGLVRMPLLVRIDGDMILADAVSGALRQWRFEPPTVNGRPVVVQVRQAFVFNQ